MKQEADAPICAEARLKFELFALETEGRAVVGRRLLSCTQLTMTLVAADLYRR